VTGLVRAWRRGPGATPRGAAVRRPSRRHRQRRRQLARQSALPPRSPFHRNRPGRPKGGCCVGSDAGSPNKSWFRRANSPGHIRGTLRFDVDPCKAPSWRNFHPREVPSEPFSWGLDACHFKQNKPTMQVVEPDRAQRGCGPHNRSASPEARSTGRPTAARTASSSPTTVSRVRARVTPV
jgi:hypothetical protein